MFSDIGILDAFKDDGLSIFWAFSMVLENLCKGIQTGGLGFSAGVGTKMM